jgi:hypothetical protein
MEHDHEHYHKPENKRSWWLSRDGIIALIFIGFIGFYLMTEHQAHFYQALPWLILLACPFMHFFMHHGHGHNHGDDNDNDREV